MSTTTTDRKTWLEARLQSVGASEVAAAIGVSPWMTPVELWQEKTGRVTRDDENEAMTWGTLLEPVILSEYERRTGLPVGWRQQRFTHPVYPFMTATLDGMTDLGKLIEVKTTSAFSRGFGEEGSDEIPEHYLVQIHAQMACTGASEADLVVLIGGQKLRIYPVTRDADLVNAIEDKVGVFWQCVQADTPPTWGRMGAKELAVLFPTCEGTVELTQSTRSVVETYENIRYSIKKDEEKAETLKAIILQALGNSQIGILPDGRQVKRYLEQTPEREVVVKYKASTRHYFKILKGGKS